jgi:isoleucyl-tRNA synthetase
MNFHIVTNALTNFCINDLGGFYLDIIKDRQYTTKADSQARRSAQTALYHIVQAFVRWMSPILSFTAQEAWPLIPEQTGKYVFTAEWYDIPTASTANLLSEADWQTLISVKSAVNKQIEAARNAKLVGSNLSAKVELWADEALQTLLNQLADELRFVLITLKSSFTLMLNKVKTLISQDYVSKSPQQMVKNVYVAGMYCQM